MVLNQPSAWLWFNSPFPGNHISLMEIREQPHLGTTALFFFYCGEKCMSFQVDIKELLMQENHIQHRNEQQVQSSLRSVSGSPGRSHLAELALQLGDQISPVTCFSKSSRRDRYKNMIPREATKRKKQNPKPQQPWQFPTKPAVERQVAKSKC